MANYRLNDKLGLAAKFEHLQYASTTVSGSHIPTGKVDDNELKPAFNLIGLQLNYYFS